ARYTRDGVAYTRRGVAHSISHLAKSWQTKDGGLVASNYDGDWQHYLHSRPVPAEPKGLGAVVRAKVAASRLDVETVWTLVRTEAPVDPWADERECFWNWSDLDPDSIEELSEGIVDDLTKEESNE